MRTSIRSEEIPHVRDIPATIHSAALTRRRSTNHYLRLRGTNPTDARRVAGNRVGGGAFRVRAHPQIFGYAVNFPIQKYLQAQSIVAPSSYISCATLVFHLVFSWVAVQKLGMGLFGAALVLSLSWWVIVIAQFIYIVKSERCKQTWGGFSFEAFFGVAGVFQTLGGFGGDALPRDVVLSNSRAARGVASSAGVGSRFPFHLLLKSFVVRRLVQVLQKERYVVGVINTTTISGWVFMISVGFNAAASVRVSNELGARNPKSASFSVVVVTVISFIISVIVAVVILLLRDVISYAFTEGEEVAAAVSDLCPLLALSIVLNGIQPVLSGVAVGCGWQTFVAYVNVGCYYGIGIPLGAVMGFYFKFNAKGIWLGMLGGTVLQTLILMWVTFRTDWNKEVVEAERRLNQWEDVKEPLLKN
ncbi:hypothetical protein ACSQ67_022874 [Phaseolus vulgaris]